MNGHDLLALFIGGLFVLGPILGTAITWVFIACLAKWVLS